MKKFIYLFMVFALAFVMTACGDDKTTEKKVPEKAMTEEAKVEDTSHVIENGIDTEEGTVKYIGMEKANKKLTTESENVWVFKFEYCNKLSEPKDLVNKYEIAIFQNGVECDSISSWNSDGGEQYDLVSNSFDKVMDGGMLNCGRIFILSEESPVKVFIEEKSTGKTVSFDVEKPQITEVTEDVIKAALLGTWRGDSNGTEIILEFNDDNMTFSANGLSNTGTYTIDTENSVIPCSIAGSTGGVYQCKIFVCIQWRQS